jgi:hypothetical protein
MGDAHNEWSREPLAPPRPPRSGPGAGPSRRSATDGSGGAPRPSERHGASAEGRVVRSALLGGLVMVILVLAIEMTGGGGGATEAPSTEAPSTEAPSTDVPSRPSTSDPPLTTAGGEAEPDSTVETTSTTQGSKTTEPRDAQGGNRGAPRPTADPSSEGPSSDRPTAGSGSSPQHDPAQSPPGPDKGPPDTGEGASASHDPTTTATDLLPIRIVVLESRSSA